MSNSSIAAYLKKRICIEIKKKEKGVDRFMKKKLLTILLAAAMLLLIPAAVYAEGEEPSAVTTGETAAAEEVSVQTGWNADRTEFRDENGNLVKGLFKAKMIDDVGALFYADENGKVVKTEGLVTVKYPNTRFLRTSDSEGHVGFREVGAADKNSYTYLIGEEGAIVETAKIYTTSEGKVVVQNDGTVMKKAGFIDVVGKDGKTRRYYVRSTGFIRTKSGFLRLKGDLYRFGKGGVVRTKEGQFKVGSDRYVIPKGADGVVATKKGVAKANGKLYFVRSKYGKLGSNKAYKLGSRVYHVNKYGLIRLDKHKWKDGKYYFATKWGYLKTKTGMVKRNGYRFLVKKGGLVVVNTKFKYKNHYYIANKYGSIKTDMFKWKGTLYYANKNGVLKTKAGIVEYKGNDYFVWAGGEVAVNKMFYWNGKLYCSDENGHLRTGLFKKGNTYYIADADHSVRTSEEVLKYRNNYYFNKRGGGLARNEWVEYGGKHYYAGDSAAFKTSTFTISGVTFHPAGNGEISDEEYKKLFPDPAEDEGADEEDVD